MEQLPERPAAAAAGAYSYGHDQLSSGRGRQRPGQLHHPDQLGREGGRDQPAGNDRSGECTVSGPDLHAVRGTMSLRHSTTIRRLGRAQLGFTLVELMITVAIALFLLGGLVTILQNVRSAYNNQQSLAQLQDQQRFAMTVLTDVIQAGGYFPDAPVWQPLTSLPLAGPYAAGQAFTGTHAGGVPDSIGVRYRTAINDGVIVCTGATNTAQGPTHLYTNKFTVVPPAGNVPGQLLCQLDGIAPPLAIVNGVQGLLV